MKKSFAILLALLMLLTVGCSAGQQSLDSTPVTGESSAAPDDPGTAAKDTVTIAVSTEPTTLNIDETNLVYDLLVWQMVYSRLIRFGDDMSYELDLAESYKMVSDTQWDFTLRQGVKFSDGTDLTAEDVKASLQAIHDSGAVGAFAAWLDHIDIQDDYHFSIYTTEPSSRILMDLAYVCFIVPSELLASDYNFNEKPVGSGQYIMTDWSKGHSLTFVANENYYIPEKTPKIKNLVYRIMPEGISRTISLQNGEVDYLYDVQASDLETLKADANVAVYSTDAASPFYLAFNLNKPMMQDVNVRKAIAMAINRENASIAATGGYAQPLYSGFCMGLIGSSDEKAVQFDPEGAKALLATTGYTAEQLAFTVVTKEETFRVALESIQADLEEIGVTININMVDNAAYTSLPTTDDYDMVVGKTLGFNQVAVLQSSMQTGAAYGQCHLSDAFVDEKLQEALYTVDDTTRAAIIKGIIDYCDENCFRTGIYQLCNTRAYSVALDGFNCNMSGYDRFEGLNWK